jgi:predicted small lipoprotein YifL
MFNRIAIIIVICFTLAGCNQTGKYYPPGGKDTSKQSSSKADSLAALTQTVETGLAENDLQLFCNNEIAPYCVLLPLHEFKEDYTDSLVVKAQHKFVLKQDPKSFTSIEVQAFTIDKKNNYNTALFYKRDKNDVEEGGLGIDTAYIDEAKHLYYIKGYLPNYMNLKFVQLNWILEDRIAVYFNYDEKDEATWKKRIAAIIKRGAAFADK